MLDGLNWLLERLTPSQETIAHVTVLVALVGFSLWVYIQMQDLKWAIRARRIATMSFMGKKRRDYLDRILSDIITNGLEDAEANELLTRNEVSMLNLKCGHRLDLPDLWHPRIVTYPNQADLKEDIKARRAKANKEPVKFPEEKPEKAKKVTNGGKVVAIADRLRNKTSA